MSLERKSTRQLMDIADEIDADIRSGNLTRNQEVLANKELDAVIAELKYRERGDQYNTSNNRNNNDGVSRYFGKTSEVTMTTGTMFGTGIKKGFAPEPSKNDVREERVETRSNVKEKSNKTKVCFIPRYPFITSTNVKEVLETTEQMVGDTLWFVNKREFTGNDDAIEFRFEHSTDYETNPLYNNVNNIAYICNIENPKIPKSVLKITPSEEETSIGIEEGGKTISRFVYNEINLDISNSIQALDYYVELKNLDDIKAFLNKTDFKTEYLKHISKVYKSFRIDIKADYLELILNKKHIYANIPNLEIPSGDKFFVSEASNETVYQLIKSVSTECKSYMGIIEGFDFKFKYYVGVNRILLVRA